MDVVKKVLRIQAVRIICVVSVPVRTARQTSALYSVCAAAVARHLDHSCLEEIHKVFVLLDENKEGRKNRCDGRPNVCILWDHDPPLERTVCSRLASVGRRSHDRRDQTRF